MEVIVAGIFCVYAHCCDEFMELVLRCFVKLADIVQASDEHADHHQGQHRYVVGLTFYLHAALLR